MWLSVDRIEGDLVILIDDEETVYRLSVAAYQTLVGQPPRESHMLWCEVDGEIIRSARLDPDETERRTQAARDKLTRLINKSNRKG